MVPLNVKPTNRNEKLRESQKNAEAACNKRGLQLFSFLFIFAARSCRSRFLHVLLLSVRLTRFHPELGWLS